MTVTSALLSLWIASTDLQVAIAASQTERVVATLSEDGAICIWDVPSMKKRAELALTKHESPNNAGYNRFPATGICFDPNLDDTLYYFNAVGLFAWKWSSLDSPSLLFSNNEAFGRSTIGLSSHASVTIRRMDEGVGGLIVDSFNNRLLFRVQGKTRSFIKILGKRYPLATEPIAASLSESQWYVMTQDTEIVKIRENVSAERGLEILDLCSDPFPITSLSVSPDNKSIAFSNRRGSLRVCDLATGRTSAVRDADGAATFPVFFKSTGCLIDCNVRGRLSVYKNLKICSTIGSSYESGFSGVAVLAKSNLLLALSEKGIICWDVMRRCRSNHEDEYHLVERRTLRIQRDSR